MKKFFAGLFKDDEGRIVIWQSPNPPLYVWMVFSLAARVVDESLRAGSILLSRVSLCVWACLEIMKGVNYFRRGLGLTVLLLLAYNSFQ